MNRLAWFVVTLLVSSASVAAQPAESPLRRSRDLAPVPKNYLEGKLKPIEEMAVREAIKHKTVHEIGMPFEPQSYDAYESDPKLYREQRARTPSGLWKLTILYQAVRGDWFRDSMPDGEIASFGPGLERWISSVKDSPTPIIYNTIALMSYARAAKYLRTTTEQMTQERMDAYNHRVRHVEKYILGKREVGSRDPHWYTLWVATLGLRCAPDDEVDKALDESSQRYPDYYQTYFAAIHNVLQCSEEPQAAWLRIKKIVDLGVQRTAATDGTGFYARGYWYAASFLDGAPSHIPLIDWPRMRAGMTDVLARNREPWNVNNFAKFACHAGDKGLLADLLPEVLETPIASVWETPEMLAKCVEFAGQKKFGAK